MIQMRSMAVLGLTLAGLVVACGSPPVTTRAITQNDGSAGCLDDGESCYSDEDCCTGSCDGTVCGTGGGGGGDVWCPNITVCSSSGQLNRPTGQCVESACMAPTADQCATLCVSDCTSDAQCRSCSEECSPCEHADCSDPAHPTCVYDCSSDQFCVNNACQAAPCNMAGGGCTSRFDCCSNNCSNGTCN